MDKSVIKVLLDGLESSNAGKVLDSLIKMKAKVREECGMRSLVESDGLQQLVTLLSKPHEKILDAALSLLGDCCLKEECVLAMKPLNIAQPLVLILKTVAKDSIIGRSCRLMGNLAQNPEVAEKFHNAGAVAALVSTIDGADKSTNHATLIMAVRALRFLWMVKHRQSEMLTSYVARSVTMLLIAECEKSKIISVVGVQQPENDNKKITKQARDDLFVGMLKCLSMFTFNTDPRCADQIQGDGRGYRCLVALTNDFESLALHCISNLCKTPSARPILGASGAVECLVTYLSGIPDAELWPKRCAAALSLLCREAVNRQKLRLARGLRLLLAAARSRAHVAHATPALLHFRYDELGFRILLAEGLAALVVGQLHCYLAAARSEHAPRPRTEPPPSPPGDAAPAGGSPSAGAESPLKRKQNAALCPMLKKARYVASPQFSSLSLASTSCASSSTSPPRDDYGSFYTESFTSDIPSRWGSSNGDCSPDRGSDKSLLPFKWPSSWSPASSPLWCSSPKNSDFDRDSSGSEHSGHYSPVCSDVEEDGAESGPPTLMGVVLDPDEPENIETLDNEVINYEIMDSVEENSDSEDILLKFYETADMNCEFPGSKMQINCIIGLLSRISHTNVYAKSYYTVTPWTYDQSLTTKPQRQSVDSPTETASPSINVNDLLVTKDFLDSFLEYMSKCKAPGGRVSRILLRLISIPTNLLRLLQNNLPRKLYELENKPEHWLSKCISCKKLKDTSIKLQQQLRTIAESDYGIGEISYQLLKGSKEMKRVLAQNLPFILSSHKPLEKMLVECKLLDILMDTRAEATATAVSRLAINLKIRNPKSNIFRMIMKAAKKLPAQAEERPDGCESIVFQLDDLTIVETDKTFLCQQSEVFNAMLTGGFREAREACVRLPFVSKASFEYLVTLLRSGARTEPVPTFPLPDSLDTALETLILTDRFLLEKLCVFLSRGIIFFKMQPNNADKIYIWSLNEGMGFLCIEALAYMLTGEMSERERWRLFENILKTEYKQQWLEDIENALLRHSSSSYFVKK